MKVKGFVSVALAYPAAAAVGAAVVAVEFGAFAFTEGASTGMAEFGYGGEMLVVAWLYAFIVFLLGLLIVGTPVWLLMARLKRNQRLDATVCGAVLAGLAGFVIMQMFSGVVWSWTPLAYAAALALPGAAAGWTLHRVAYGRRSA
ncbi:hypothetical protein [Brevundimonas sp.]|uniref:hypothetical protein n=1 Tax=Brevundimonas sp. TaxID=1871086 RepID=UPI0026379E74|nr:hypothetical protein [Brevundimonas sp.]